MATSQMLFSGALTLGIPLALAIGQVIAWRRRPRRRDDWQRPHEPLPRPPKPLPDCLIPRLIPRPVSRPMSRNPGPRIRVLEDA